MQRRGHRIPRLRLSALLLSIPVLFGLIVNGANRDRTGDLLLAKQALSQLSYGPEAL